MKKLMMAGGFALMVVALAACSDPTSNMTAANTGEAKDEVKQEGKELKFDQDSSKVGFVGSKVTGSHDGGFKKFTGVATIEGDTLKQVEVIIDMNSIWTDDVNDDNTNLTGHLKNDDFFNVEKYPESRFVSTEIKKDGAKHVITGNLTMRDVTKSVTFDADVTLKDGKLTAKAEFKINRRDWNVNYDGKANDLIRDDVGLKLEINAG